MNRENKYRGSATRRREGGFSLIEIAIVVTLIGILMGVAAPSVTRTFEAGRGKSAARSIVDAFSYARAQAIRSGNNQVVFFAVGGAGDTAGTALTAQDGTPVPILVLDDGRPGSVNQDCNVDAGEGTLAFRAEDGVGWGANSPPNNVPAPDDELLTIPAAGSSFRAPDRVTPVTWVLFRPDGVPVAIDAACNLGRLGSGSGTIYLWTANRDYAVTLSPLGAARVHTWDPGRGAWTS